MWREQAGSFFSKYFSARIYLHECSFLPLSLCEIPYGNQKEKVDRRCEGHELNRSSAMTDGVVSAREDSIGRRLFSPLDWASVYALAGVPLWRSS